MHSIQYRYPFDFDNLPANKIVRQINFQFPQSLPLELITNLEEDLFNFFTTYRITVAGTLSADNLTSELELKSSNLNIPTSALLNNPLSKEIIINVFYEDGQE